MAQKVTIDITTPGFLQDFQEYLNEGVTSFIFTCSDSSIDTSVAYNKIQETGHRDLDLIFDFPIRFKGNFGGRRRSRVRK